MVRVGIIGGAGYTGGEAIRILFKSPGCRAGVRTQQQQRRQPSERRAYRPVGRNRYAFYGPVAYRRRCADAVRRPRRCPQIFRSHADSRFGADHRPEPGFSAAGDCFDREQAVRVRPAGTEPRKRSARRATSPIRGVLRPACNWAYCRWLRPGC